MQGTAMVFSHVICNYYIFKKYCVITVLYNYKYNNKLYYNLGNNNLPLLGSVPLLVGSRAWSISFNEGILLRSPNTAKAGRDFNMSLATLCTSSPVTASMVQLKLK